MNIECEPLPGGVLKINLSGRMDLPSVDSIEAEFNHATAAPQKSIVIDLTGVSFITSFGIRILIATAKALHRRSGHLVLLGPNPVVANILQTAGIDTVIPITFELPAALAAVSEKWVSPNDHEF